MNPFLYLLFCMIAILLLFWLLIRFLNKCELMAKIIWDEGPPIEYGPFSSFKRFEIWRSAMFDKYGERITQINYFYRKIKKP